MKKVIWIALILTLCSCDRQFFASWESTKDTKDSKEYQSLKDLNATLSKLVIGLKKNVCFKLTADNQTCYFKAMFDYNVENKHSIYYRSEVKSIDSMKAVYVWQKNDYIDLEYLFAKGNMVECKDVPK